MRRLLVTSILLAIFICSFAIPSTREPFSVKQSDGTSLSLVLIGDEVFHILTTLDGVPVIESNDSYFYATVQDDKLVPSNTLAHNSDIRSKNENIIVTSLKDVTNKVLSLIWSKQLNKRNEARSRRGYVTNTNESRRRDTFGHSSSYIGKKKGLVILAEFPDLKFNSANTNNEFYQFFNQTNYSKNNFAGSVHDYFLDQSYGQFDISFDIIGPITLSKSYSYYGKNDSEGNDMHVCEMVQEACTLISEECDFLTYDWNGDNEVEQVYIVYAGPGEHTGAGSKYIWPHEWNLDEGLEQKDGTGPITIGGATINTYAMSCELAPNSSSTMDGIGTACHEFSHCLGLPDAYCTNNDSYAFAMSYWDLLAKGSSNGTMRHGEAPCGYTAYERWFAGWLEPIELSSPCDVTNIPCLADAPIAYIIYNDANRNEFFILENRQPSDKWYKYTSSFSGLSGLLIYHIDYDNQAWEDNEVNWEYSHQRMSVVPADDSYGRFSQSTMTYSASQYDLAGDLFPGYYNTTEFTDDSHKNHGGKLFNQNTDGTYFLHKPITNIQEKDGLISFCFMGGGETIDCNGIRSLTTNNTDTEYYNLSGMKTSVPYAKGLYITRQNGIVTKVIR